MKNTIRVRRNGAINPASAQTKTQRQRPAAPLATTTPETIIPAQVAQEAEAAISNLERIGKATVAFAMMNGYSIKEISRDGRGWESLDVPGFSDGVLELARIASNDFAQVFTEITGAFKIMVATCREVSGPVKIAEDNRAKYKFILQIDPHNSWSRIESVINALIHCINLQGWALCLEHAGCEQAGGFEICRHIESANKSLEQVTMKLMDAYGAVMASREVAS